MRLLTGLVAIAFPLVACINASPETKEIDFMGEVAGVEFSEAWVLEPEAVSVARGGPSSEVTVGPQDIALVGGRILRVPANTPGGNQCLELIHPSLVAGITGEPAATVDDVPRFESNYDWTVPCVIMGQLAPDGTVAWFQVLDISSVGGVDLAVVGEVREVDTASLTVTTADGYRFALGSDETDCGQHPSEVRSMNALADWETGIVVVLSCLPDF